MLFRRSRLWIIQSTVLSCLHAVWLTNGVTHDQSAREPDFTRASRVIRHRPGYASLVHSFIMLFQFDRRGATVLDGSTLHPIRCCSLHRLVPVDTSAGSNGRHRPADCSVRHRWCHGTLLISLLLINSDQLRRPPVQRPAALQRPRRLVRVGRASRDASASAIGRYPLIGRLPSLAASTIMAIYFRSLHGVQVASRSTKCNFPMKL
jgi:hypothetical protein